MARKYLMAWEPTPHRWAKMHKGQRYYINCADLGLPESLWTKEASYQAANEWWLKQVGTKKNEPGTPEAMNTVLEATLGKPIENKLDESMALANLMDDWNTMPADLRKKVAMMILGKDRLEQIEHETTKVLEAAAIDKTYRLEANVRQFLELEQAKKRKPRTFGELSASINAIIKTDGVLYPSMDVRTINEKTVQDFYLFLRKGKRADYQQKKQFEYFKRLVKSLWSARLIELPRNLEDDWDFNVKTKKVKAYETKEIALLLGKLPPRLKLYALLGLNCGMLSVDVSSLRKDQVDLTKGRIKRKRTKEEDEETTPEVDYLLWPETVRLLKQCWSDDPLLALTTSAGTPLVRAWIEDGKEKVSNMLRLQSALSGKILVRGAH